MTNFFNAKNDTVYIHLTGIIDKETYLNVLDVVISVHNKNSIKGEVKQKVIVFINISESTYDEYSLATFSLLKTIKDQLYTINFGAIDISTYIFLLANQKRRYMTKHSRISFYITGFENKKRFLNAEDFKSLNNIIKNYTRESDISISIDDSSSESIFTELGIKAITGNIIDAINDD